MSERKEKSPEQVSDEDFKVAPTSADRDIVKKESLSTSGNRDRATGEGHGMPPEGVVQEELKEGVE
ncbi:MAG TPA: hypothetical protein VJP79_00485 [Nitrososphaera sp.]|nr:hypothetical protein [Nitrososphaera sp.]